MEKAYQYIRNEFIAGINVWSVLSFGTCSLIFLPIFLTFYNFNAESENWSHIKQHLLFSYFSSTLYLVIGVGIVSTIIGVGCAWFVSAYNFTGRKYVEVILILPLTIPTYIASYAYYDILEILNPIFIWTKNTVGLEGAVFIENMFVHMVVILLFSFVLYPYIYLSSRASLLVQGSKAIEAANMLGVSSDRLLQKVIIPLIRPAIVAGLSLVVMETLNDYAAVEYFGVSTLTIGIFRSWFGMYDMNAALRLSTFLITFVFLTIALEKFTRQGAKYDSNLSKTSLKRTDLKGKSQILIITFCLVPITIGFCIPVGRLLSWVLRPEVTLSNLNLFAITLNTVVISFFSSILIVILAFLIVFSKNYFNNGPLKKVSQVATLGYSIPGAIIAIGILKLSSAIEGLTSLLLIGSISGLIFSYVVRFLAVAWQPIDSSMSKFGTNINMASRTLNVKPLKSLFKVNYGVLKKPIFIACLIVFIDISKELPITLILRPFNFDTLSTLTYDLVNQAQFYQSSIPSLIIISISLPAILLIKNQMDKGS